MEMLGQPNDDFHQFMHKLRKAYKRVYVRQNSNVLLRESLNMREFDKHGVTAAKLPLDAALLADMYSWRSLPEEVVRSLRSNRQTYRQSYRQTAKAALTNFDKDRSSKRDGPFVHTYAYIYVYIYIHTQNASCVLRHPASFSLLQLGGLVTTTMDGVARHRPRQKIMKHKGKHTKILTNKRNGKYCACWPNQDPHAIMVSDLVSPKLKMSTAVAKQCCRCRFHLLALARPKAVKRKIV